MEHFLGWHGTNPECSVIYVFTLNFRSQLETAKAGLVENTVRGSRVTTMEELEKAAHSRILVKI